MSKPRSLATTGPRRCSCGPRQGSAEFRSRRCWRGERLELRHKLEREVRYANITIIEGHAASQYGIGIVSARIAEMVLNDERAVIPIGSYQKKFGVTLSLPSVVGRGGAIEVLEPKMSHEEREELRKSADALNKALERVRKGNEGEGP
jgi:L-lactate dehydrogenase